MNNRGLIVVISDFSGAGKGTVMKELLKRYDNYELSISATTRNPRPGEENGREYYFVTKEEFEKLIEENGLVEHAQYLDKYYGTPRKFVEEKLELGKDVILEIDEQGARQIKKKFPKALLLFITPPSIEELEKRLRGRQTETEEVIHGRLLKAKEEGQYIDEYDNIVINDDVENCVTQMHGIIQAAHYTPGRNEAFIKQIQEQLAELQ